MAVPLVVGDTLLGVLDVQSDVVNHFTEDDVQIQTTLATQIAIAVQNAHSFEQTRTTLVENQHQRRTLQTILDNMPLGVFVIDAKTNRPQLVNQAGNTLLGYEVDLNQPMQVYRQLYRLGTNTLVPPEERVVAKVMAGAELAQAEEDLVQPNGSRITINVTAVPIRNEQAEIVSVLVLFQDITERKQAEEALRASQESLSEALKTAKLANWEFDVATQVFTFNDQFYALLHTTAEQEGGYQMPAMQYAQKFVHPDEAYLVGVEIQKALETTDPNFRGELEHRIIRADGSEGYIVVRFRVAQDEQGRTIKTIGANQDISERKQIDEALRASEARQRALLNAIPDLIMRLSGDGIYLDIKPARDFPTMVPPEQLIGKNSFEVLPPDLAAQRQSYIEQALKTGEIQTYEHQLERSDRAAYEEVRVIPSGKNEVLMTIRDISDRKQADLERERLLAEVEAAYRQYVRREWTQFLGERQGNWRIEHQVRPIEAATERLDQLQNEVMYEGKTKVNTRAKDNGQIADPAIVAPIALRGQVIGALSLQDVDLNRIWTAEEKALVETVSEQLALTIENLRLVDDTQKQATREQLARQITDKLRAAPDVDSIIETGLAELGKALGVSRTYLKLTTKLEGVEPPH
jgi:PAS domain S-box-containing protein